jgi:hypothetical protein
MALAVSSRGALIERVRDAAYRDAAWRLDEVMPDYTGASRIPAPAATDRILSPVGLNFQPLRRTSPVRVPTTPWSENGCDNPPD